LRKLIFYRAERGEQPQNKIIYHLKHNANARMARFLAEELKGAALNELAVLGKEKLGEECVIVSVPRGRSAKSKYGFDQAELIGRALGDSLKVPYEAVIRRRWGGREQKKLSRERRFRNIRHLFCLKEADAVRGKCVLLLDDVVTTGASMAACVNLLRKAGASSIICLCIAQD
jgi:ComF family protein